MTVTLDFSALESAIGPRVQLLPGTTTDRAGTGTDYADFSDFAAVYLRARAVLRATKDYNAAQLVLTVEHSDNGISWSTAHAFTFTRDGDQAFALDSPKAHMRVTWTVAGSSEWYVPEVTAAPTIADAAGGGSLPSGGTTGQVLTKASNADGDADWEDSSGGSQPGAVVVKAFAIAFDTANLLTGHALYTPAVGDQILDWWVVPGVDEFGNSDWDGTTPSLDLGQFSAGDTHGWRTGMLGGSPVDMTNSGSSSDSVSAISFSFNGWIKSNNGSFAIGVLGPISILNADPIEVVVTQDGLPGGDDPGSMAGTAVIYIATATPTVT